MIEDAGWKRSEKKIPSRDRSKEEKRPKTLIMLSKLNLTFPEAEKKYPKVS